MMLSIGLHHRVTIYSMIALWAKFNGFRFSPTKTTMMEFFEKRQPVRVISLFINGTVIKKSENAKFLGLTWDAKLNWITHIHNIKSKCAKDLNLMRSDQETLLLEKPEQDLLEKPHLNTWMLLSMMLCVLAQEHSNQHQLKT